MWIADLIRRLSEINGSLDLDLERKLANDDNFTVVIHMLEFY